LPWAIAPSTEAATIVATMAIAKRIGSTNCVERRSSQPAVVRVRTSPAPPTTYSTDAAGLSSAAKRSE
jgi:hypothetical protein